MEGPKIWLGDIFFYCLVQVRILSGTHNQKLNIMELQEGEYKIPRELCAVLRGGDTVIVKKRTRYNQKKYCRDCIHQKRGKVTLKDQWYESPYCELRRKKDGIHFYSAHDTILACENFEQK